MACEKEEYQCTVSLRTAFDPVNITPTTFLYDRNTAETWVEKNPRNATIPHTRQPFVAADIIPNVGLREEMRQYFQDVMGSEYTGWEVIPDYPQLLSLHAIRDLIVQVRQFFPDEDEELRQMSEEKWSKARKLLNYLRLNLQMEPHNRQLFLSDEPSILCLGEIMYRSYYRHGNNEESDLFHREALRTIRVLDISEQRNNDSECARFIGCLLRNFQVTEEGFHSTALCILSIIPTPLKSEQLTCVLEYLMRANPIALSSTDLKNIAVIAHIFYSTKIINGDIPTLRQMSKRLVRGLVQVFINALGIFKSQDRKGIVEDAYQALHLPLFLIDQLLNGDQILLGKTALESTVEMNLLAYIHEMIEMYLQQQSPHLINVSENDWLLALSIVRTLYLNSWTVDRKRVEEHSRLLSLHRSQICEQSVQVRDSVMKLLELFHHLLIMRERQTSTP